MARPLRITYAGAFYHVTARGNERKAAFKSTGGREKFKGTYIVLSFQVARHKKLLLSNNLFPAFDYLARRGLSQLKPPGKFHCADVALTRPLCALTYGNVQFFATAQV